MIYVLTYLRAFVPFPFTWLHFFACLTCLYLFACLMCLYFLRALRALIFLLASHAFTIFHAFIFFMCLTCLRLFRVFYFFTCLTCPYFLHTLHFIYVFGNKTLRKLMNLPTLFIFAIIESSHLSMFIKYFNFYKTRVISCIFFLLWKWKILITLNAEENNRPFERFKHCLK